MSTPSDLDISHVRGVFEYADSKYDVFSAVSRTVWPVFGFQIETSAHFNFIFINNSAAILALSYEMQRSCAILIILVK